MEVQGRIVRVDGHVLRVARLAAEHFDFFPDPVSAIDVLRCARERVDLFTFVERIAQVHPRYDYWREADNLAVLTVSTFEQWWNRQVNGKTRNMVRRAEKCRVLVREMPFDDECVRGILEVYNESEFRQGKRFTHYGKTVDAVRRENGTFLDQAIFIGAYLHGELIGFAKIVKDGGSAQAGLMQIVSMVRHRDKSPTNALVAQAVRSCSERGIRHLFYSHFAYGRKLRDGLAAFKEHNGFARVEVLRYYVPVTVLGRVGLALRLHRQGLVHYVPDSVQTALRKVRERRLDARS